MLPPRPRRISRRPGQAARTWPGPKSLPSTDAIRGQGGGGGPEPHPCRLRRSSDNDPHGRGQGTIQHDRLPAFRARAQVAGQRPRPQRTVVFAGCPFAWAGGNVSRGRDSTPTSTKEARRGQDSKPCGISLDRGGGPPRRPPLGRAGGAAPGAFPGRCSVGLTAAAPPAARRL